MDDYHSKIISTKIEKYTNQEDKSKIVKILGEYNCKISINVDCINGGEGENLLCKLKMNVGFVHPQISEIAQKLLEKDMGIALEPVKNIIISKDHETDDFENYTRSVNYIFMFVFATVNLHCGCFEAAVKLFEEIYDLIASETTLINSLYLIKTSLPNRIGFCNAVMAQVNYNLYCENRDSKYLIAVRKCIDNVHCKKFNDKSLVVLRGICYFVIDKNIKAAEQCMNEASKNDPVIKFNKVFLKLYGNPSATNFLKSYHTYKYLNKLNQNSIEQIEGLVYDEYSNNTGKWQLLFLLFMIYDYQNNDKLAKKALILLCSNESAKQVIATESFGSIIDSFEKKYKDVELSSDEEYSL